MPLPKPVAIQTKGITPEDRQAAKEVEVKLNWLSVRFYHHAPDHRAFYAINRALREVNAAIKFINDSES